MAPPIVPGPMVQFEPTVTLGALIQMVVFVVSILIGYSKFVSRMTKLETKLNILWGVFTRQIGTRTREDDAKFFGDGGDH